MVTVIIAVCSHGHMHCSGVLIKFTSAVLWSHAHNVNPINCYAAKVNSDMCLYYTLLHTIYCYQVWSDIVTKHPRERKFIGWDIFSAGFNWASLYRYNLHILLPCTHAQLRGKGICFVCHQPYKSPDQKFNIIAIFKYNESQTVEIGKKLASLFFKSFPWYSPWASQIWTAHLLTTPSGSTHVL